MRLFEPMCESSHCCSEEWSVFGGWFSWFLGRQLTNKWLCTTNNWLFCVVLVVRLRHVQFSGKTGDHLLGSVSCASNFCWIWLILKHPYSRLLFTFGLIRVNPLFVTCRDVMDVFEAPRSYFWSISFDQLTRAFLWRIGKLSGIQREQICLTVKFSCNIECMLVPLMPKVVSISRWVTWRSCNISWRTASLVSGTTTDFGQPLLNSSGSELQPRLNSKYHR